jgi:hypothetical protein
MGRKSADAYDRALGLRESEARVAASFAAEFQVVVGRTVTLMSEGESPDRNMLIDGIETGVELTAIHADGAEQIIQELLPLASQKHESFARRDLFAARPMILLGHLDWPSPETEGSGIFRFPTTRMASRTSKMPSARNISNLEGRHLRDGCCRSVGPN